MKLLLSVLFLSATAYAADEEDFADTSAQTAYTIYSECSNDVGFSVCLKKKAVTFLDRIGRMENVTLAPGVNIVLKPDANCNETVVNGDVLEQTLPRAIDAKEDALSYMLVDKFFKYVGSRNLELSLPKFDAEELIEEGNKLSFVLFKYYLVVSLLGYSFLSGSKETSNISDKQKWSNSLSSS